MNYGLKKYIKAALRTLGYYKIIKTPVSCVSQNQAFWDRESEFNVLYEQIKDYTLLSKNRCFMLYQFLRYANNLDGDMAEVGVYKGGTAKLIAKIALHKNVYLFDTFSGMPKTCLGVDIHNEGEFGDVSLKLVRRLLKDCPNVTFYSGIFPDTAGPIQNKNFSFVHIDVDIYRSIKDCLEFFYGRMVSAGVIIIDDYDSSACPGVKKAVSEFLTDKKMHPIVTTEAQCAIIKL